MRTLILLMALQTPAHAGEALIAVATNFLPCAEDIADGYGPDGDTLSFASGSTGKLAAQIEAGAPFDAFLAADQARPARLEAGGHAHPGSRFTYALGRLALWSADPERIGADGPAALNAPFRRLAIAHPDLAPYGTAAMETLASLGLTETVQGRLVRGENVGQALALAATGNADLGFVAVAGLPEGGSRWLVPADLHAPIRQDAVLISDNPAAAAFLGYLASPEGRAAIAQCGYDLPGDRS